MLLAVPPHPWHAWWPVLQHLTPSPEEKPQPQQETAIVRYWRRSRRASGAMSPSSRVPIHLPNQRYSDGSALAPGCDNPVLHGAPLGHTAVEQVGVAYSTISHSITLDADGKNPRCCRWSCTPPDVLFHLHTTTETPILFWPVAQRAAAPVLIGIIRAMLLLPLVLQHLGHSRSSLCCSNIFLLCH